jgi:glycosyltransferase involved in cell wall biosynthesis
VTELSILILSRYGSMGASSRLRMLQYVPSLERNGFKVTVSPFFSDQYIRCLYGSGQRRVVELYRAYSRRLWILFQLRRYSVVWVEKEILPFLPSWFEGWIARSGVSYFVDYDDATFHTYDQHSNFLVRQLLGKKLVSLLEGAAVVSVGNSYLEDYVRQHGGTRVDRIPTVVDLDRYPLTPEPDSAISRIGWIGTPGTAKYLNLIREPLSRLAKRRSIRLVTIGAPELTDFGVSLEQHPWAVDTEADLLRTLHVGVMPLPDSCWERGKCGYKLIQYMACGRAVVASPVGMNMEIVIPRANGYLAKDSLEWEHALECLIDNAAMRIEIGQLNRRKVETTYSLQAQAPRVVELFVEVTRARKRHFSP